MLNSNEVEGYDEPNLGLGDYPVDGLLIRSDNRTIYDVCRRIKRKGYIMDPDFQRGFIWDEYKQSRLIESVIFRIPLPVFYLAEDVDGKMIVVDGLQRLTTLYRFINDKLKLKLPGHALHGKRFTSLKIRHQNRFEDFNLSFYIIDSKVPDQVRLDIFERVNGGVPLTRQQMRNALYSGPATRLLGRESKTEGFRKVIGKSLDTHAMRDREFVNRFCSFYLLGYGEYHRYGMDEFLAAGLKKMNRMEEKELDDISKAFQYSLMYNEAIFERHAFRRSIADSSLSSRRTMINASLWDVMSVGLADRPRKLVKKYMHEILARVRELLADEAFVNAITRGTNDSRNVRTRFEMANEMFQDIFGC